MCAVISDPNMYVQMHTPVFFYQMKDLLRSSWLLDDDDDVGYNYYFHAGPVQHSGFPIV